MRVNRGLPHCLRHAHESGQRAGIINVASTAAFAPMPLFATYAASKTFLLNYTEALAEEAADVLYHLLVMLRSADVPLPRVMAILESRTAQSGHAEKASRGS